MKPLKEFPLKLLEVFKEISGKITRGIPNATLQLRIISWTLAELPVELIEEFLVELRDKYPVKPVNSRRPRLLKEFKVELLETFPVEILDEYPVKLL